MDGGHAQPAEATAHLVALQRANRAIKVNIGGVERFAAVEDAARLRDAAPKYLAAIA